MEVNDAVPSTSKARPSYSSQLKDAPIFGSLVGGGVPRGIDERCAIVLDVERDIPAEVYAESVAREIGPSALQYAGRRSGKLVIYLKDVSFAEQVVRSGIGVKGQMVQVKQLSTPLKRVVLSNVNPEVQNSVLLKCLEKYGKVSGEIRLLSAGFKNNLTHVKSLRRVCYMLLNNDTSTLNESFNVYKGNYANHIYISTEGLVCYNCGQKGHYARDCVNTAQDSEHRDGASRDSRDERDDTKQTPDTDRPNVKDTRDTIATTTTTTNPDDTDDYEDITDDDNETGFKLQKTKRRRRKRDSPKKGTNSKKKSIVKNSAPAASTATPVTPAATDKNTDENTKPKNDSKTCSVKETRKVSKVKSNIVSSLAKDIFNFTDSSSKSFVNPFSVYKATDTTTVLTDTVSSATANNNVSTTVSPTVSTQRNVTATTSDNTVTDTTTAITSTSTATTVQTSENDIKSDKSDKNDTGSFDLDLDEDMMSSRLINDSTPPSMTSYTDTIDLFNKEPPDDLMSFGSESSVCSGTTESELDDMEGLEPLQDLSLTPPSREDFMSFLIDIKGCKGQANLCRDFYPDLRYVLRELQSIKRSTPPGSFKGRLYKVVKAVKAEIRLNAQV